MDSKLRYFKYDDVAQLSTVSYKIVNPYGGAASRPSFSRVQPLSNQAQALYWGIYYTALVAVGTECSEVHTNITNVQYGFCKLD